jgi:predicted Fe-Mo cluster-binding NifX family protein
MALVRVHLADGLIEEQQIVANPYLKEEKARGIRVAEWLVAQKVDVVLVRESLRGKGPIYVFRDAGIELRQTDANTLSKSMEAQWVKDVTTDQANDVG